MQSLEVGFEIISVYWPRKISTRCLNYSTHSLFTPLPKWNLMLPAHSCAHNFCVSNKEWITKLSKSYCGCKWYIHDAAVHHRLTCLDQRASLTLATWSKLRQWLQMILDKIFKWINCNLFLYYKRMVDSDICIFRTTDTIIYSMVTILNIHSHDIHHIVSWQQSVSCFKR